MAAIASLGVVSAFGFGIGRLWTGASQGLPGIRGVQRFDTSAFSTGWGGLVPGFDEVAAPEAFLAIGRAAALEALGDRKFQPERLALVVGVSIDHEGTRFHGLVEELADAIGARGPRLTISVACASGVAAMGLGADLIAEGSADLVLAGGVDIINEETYAGFDALGVLSPSPCAPFSTPIGTTLGEGAALFLLSRDAETAKVYVSGYGLSADGYHATSPSPRGDGVERAIRGAIGDAGVSVGDVEYVNAHGTGTAANDPAEWSALRRVFGESIAVSSSKSIFGHAQGAAGALESALTCLGLEHGAMPPTRQFAGARPRCPADPVGQETPRETPFHTAVCTNSAFGGANAAVILSTRRSEASGRPRRDVLITGLGAVGPFGHSVDGLLATPQAHGLTGSFPLARYARNADPRKLYRASQLLIAACAQALLNAGLTVRGEARERTGMFVAIDELSPVAAREFRASLDQRGLKGPSARAFADMVLNAPAGACSRTLSLRGPHCVLSAGEAGGLLAVIRAAEHIAARTDADALIAGGVHEGPGSTDAEAALANGEADWGSDGAACAVLESATAHRERGPGGSPAWRCVGWGTAGPDDMESAIRRAVAQAQPGAIPSWFGADSQAQAVSRSECDAAFAGSMSPCGPSGGATSAFGTLRALGVAQGTILLLTPPAASAAGALVLEPWSPHA